MAKKKGRFQPFSKAKIGAGGRFETPPGCLSVTTGTTGTSVCIPDNTCNGVTPECLSPGNGCEDCDPCTIDQCGDPFTSNIRCECIFKRIKPIPSGCPQDEDDDDDDDGDDKKKRGLIGGEGEKRFMCHKPRTKSEHTIEVDISDVPSHLGHGDFLGSCEEAKSARALNSYIHGGIENQNSSASLFSFTDMIYVIVCSLIGRFTIDYFFNN